MTIEQEELWFDWIPVFQFILFGCLNTPPNFLWQEFLESIFPAYPSAIKAPAEKPAKDTPKEGVNPDEKSDGKSEKKPDKKPKEMTQPQGPLSIRNTAIKLILDQTLGAAVNTFFFSAYMRSIRSATAHAPRSPNFRKAVSWWNSEGAVNFAAVHVDDVLAGARADFWQLMYAGWTFWPGVSLVNYSLIKTIEGRTLVGATAGLLWGVYVSLMAA